MPIPKRQLNNNPKVENARPVPRERPSYEETLCRQMLQHAVFGQCRANELTISDLKYHLQFFFADETMQRAIGMLDNSIRDATKDGI